MEKSSAQTIVFWIVCAAGLLALTAALTLPTAAPPATYWAQQTFAYFVNTLPFLILGSLTAGFLHHYLTPQTLKTYTPHSLRNGLLTAALLGLPLPFGPVGIIPIVWLLLKKQFPPHLALTLLLAAPAVNPITFLALTTSLNIGWAIAITTLSLIIALITGSIAHRLIPLTTSQPLAATHQPPPTSHPFWTPVTTASDTLLTFLPFFIIGCLLSALWDTTNLALWLTAATPPLAAVFPIALLSADHPLTNGPTAAGLLTTISAATTAAYLTLSTMFGLTTSTTLLPLFKPRTIAFLIILISMLTFASGLIINLFV